MDERTKAAFEQLRKSVLSGGEEEAEDLTTGTAAERGLALYKEIQAHDLAEFERIQEEARARTGKPPETSQEREERQHREAVENSKKQLLRSLFPMSSDT